MSDITAYVDGMDNAATHHFVSLHALADHFQYDDLTGGNFHGTGSSGKLNITISTAIADTFHSFTSLVTSSSYYVTVTVDSSVRHPGHWSDSAYRITPVTDQYAAIGFPAHSRVDGVQITPATAATSNIMEITSGPVYYSNSLFRGHGDGGYTDTAVSVAGSSTVAYFTSCAFFRFQGGGAGTIVVNTTGGEAYLWNCTVRSANDYGIRRLFGSLYLKNTYVSTASGTAISGATSMTNCASSDTSAGSSNGCISNVAFNTTQFVNVTSGSENLHLAGTGSGLYGVGADNTGDAAPLNYTTDIDGDTITGRFDIGADWLAGATGQFARPSSDVADGNWLNQASSNTNLYASIDEETASDADYIRSGATPSNDTCTVGLSSISVPAAGTVTLRVRARYV